jgi:hypothetical protein
MLQFLLLRAEDMVHLGVEWAGFRLEPAVSGSRPRLTATSDSARITLTFPPQVLSERAITSGVLVSALPTHRADASRVQFAVPANTTMELNAAGIFDALKKPGVSMVSRGVDPGEEPTAIEMPWSLVVSAVTAQSGGQVVARHVAAPRSQAGVTGLWYTELRAGGSDARDAGLALVPMRSVPGDMVPPTPLAEGVRREIVANVAQGRALPRLRRLELSSIGGSLSATAKWPSLEWDQDILLGRDQRIRILTTGTLYPFGHTASLLLLTERSFRRQGTSLEVPFDAFGEPIETFSIAGLQTTALMVIDEPVRRAVSDPALAREFPFDEVEILGRSFPINAPSVDPLTDPFFPELIPGQPLQIPLRLGGRAGDVFIRTPLIFAHNFFLSQGEKLAQMWEPHSTFRLPGLPIDMLRSPARDSRRHDIHEIHELTIVGFPHANAFRPSLSEFRAELPALRAVLGDSPERPALAYTPEFLARGDEVDLALAPVDSIDVDFTRRSERSGGLMAPKYVADTISRSLGPIPKDALPGTGVPLSTLYAGAKLLGMPLADVVVDDAGRGPPKIVPIAGTPPGASMTWDLPLRARGPFQPQANGRANLIVERSAVKTNVTCTVSNFSFVLPPEISADKQLLKLTFGSLVFRQELGKAPTIELNHVGFDFLGALRLVKPLADALQALLGDRAAPKISATPSGVAASYMLGLPEVPAGYFLLRNIGVNFRVDIPFNGSPTVVVGFGSSAAPFNCAVLIFGGGGYIEVELGSSGIARLEASIEFGAMVSLDFVIASVEIHALGGIVFRARAGTIDLEAYIRIGGSVELLGLVSVSVELRVSLRYVPPTTDPEMHGGNLLIGRATLVIEVEVIFFSESVTLDSGTYELRGPRLLRTPRLGFDAAAAAPVLSGLVTYHEAFAP